MCFGFRHKKRAAAFPAAVILRNIFLTKEKKEGIL